MSSKRRGGGSNNNNRDDSSNNNNIDNRSNNICHQRKFSLPGIMYSRSSYSLSSSAFCISSRFTLSVSSFFSVSISSATYAHSSRSFFPSCVCTFQLPSSRAASFLPCLLSPRPSFPFLLHERHTKQKARYHNYGV